MFSLRNSIATFVMLILIPLTISAQTKDQSEYVSRVSISVIAKDNLKLQLTEQFSQALASIKDLKIVGDKDRADWKLSISALELETKGGYKSGVVISLVVIKPFDNSFIDDIDLQLDPDQIEAIKNATANLSNYYGNGLEIGANEDLKTICQHMVADFNNKYLAIERRTRKVK